LNPAYRRSGGTAVLVAPLRGRCRDLGHLLGFNLLASKAVH
jgi:hypothetical protein